MICESNFYAAALALVESNITDPIDVVVDSAVVYQIWF